MKAGDQISYKVGTSDETPWEDGLAAAMQLLVQTGDEAGLSPNVTSTEKVQTEEHMKAHEYLVVLRGVWE